MSRAVLTVEVDDAPSGLLGVKEAVCMALEPLGRVRVLHVEVREPEQMTIVRKRQEPYGAI